MLKILQRGIDFMCGIVGYTGNTEAKDILLDGLEKLEYRGYDSAGIAVMNDTDIAVIKTIGRIENLRHKAKGKKEVCGTAGIGHTRWATHGAPTKSNAHPHTSNSGKFAVVHNGIIENYIDLREELLNKGFTFESQTDTEVIVHLIEMYYKGDIKKAIKKALSRLKGSYALGVICDDFNKTVYATRESSPLIIGIGAGENYFASDVTALVSYTKNVIYLEDGELAEITPDTVVVFDPIGNIVSKKINHINWDIGCAQKGGYEHFMLKEIIEQPRAVKSTIATRIIDDEIVFQQNLEYVKDINKVVITACGSAFYAGCAGRYVIEKLCKIPVQTELASELRYGNSIIDENTLVIVLSQSGETADSLAAMKMCKEKGAKTLAIVNVVGSTIANEADNVIYTAAGPEIAVATTKGFTTQLAVLYLFSLYMAKMLERIDLAYYKELLNELEMLPKKIREAIDMNSNISNVAKSYILHDSMFFIGRNIDYAIALEGALKMKEISYIHAEAYAAGELKHGAIALIDDGTPVVSLCCNEDVLEKTVSNIVEVKARGANVLAIANKGNEKIVSLADDAIFVPRVNMLFSSMVEIIPLQLLSYYVAKERGCDIDKPKNLAKSVTVE